MAQAQNLEQAKAASSAQQAAMDKQLKAADEEANKYAQKRPDTSGILAAAQQAGKSGASGTMLTGPQGVSPDSLTLGKSTLLGA